MIRETFAKVIANIGFQPFLSVDMQCEAVSLEPLFCYTQNEEKPFIDGLEQLSDKTNNRFIQGLLKSLTEAPYEAMELFFAWIGQEQDRFQVQVGTVEGKNTSRQHYVGYPILEIVENKPVQSPEEKADMLFHLLTGLSFTYDSALFRWHLIEASALALSKYYGSVKQYEAALERVNIGLSVRPYAMHLKAAKFALEKKLAGQPVPPRLVKFIDHDNGYLKEFTCTQPFSRFDVGPSGDVMVCCGHWLPTSIGNIMETPAKQVLNSEIAQDIRRSVVDGTFKYCNHLECMLMVNNDLPKVEEVTKEDETNCKRLAKSKHIVEDKSVIENCINRDTYSLESITQMLFAFDQTCNLSCPSCRVDKITENFQQNTAKLEVVEKHLVPVLKGLKYLNINPAGELFASKISRKLLEYIGTEAAPDALLDIISNGTLFNKREWERYPNIQGRVRSVRISTDAATKATFEKLRRLGNWESFLENIEFLGKLKRDRKFCSTYLPEYGYGQYWFSFTYQLDNFREMGDFVRLVRKYRGTAAIFERLQNLGAFTDEEFRHRAVHLPEHPLHEEFLEVIQDPILGSKDVRADFGEFFNI